MIRYICWLYPLCLFFFLKALVLVRDSRGSLLLRTRRRAGNSKISLQSEEKSCTCIFVSRHMLDAASPFCRCSVVGFDSSDMWRGGEGEGRRKVQGFSPRERRKGHILALFQVEINKVPSPQRSARQKHVRTWDWESSNPNFVTVIT